jgi:phosphoribosylamine--glycine ligase
MGAYAPVADGTPELIEKVRCAIAQPVLDAMASQGTPYIGFLYAGLMLTAEGPKVIEFNCRLGDPEAQAVLPITASNLVEPLLAVARGEGLGDWAAEAADEVALITVLASEGYPGPYEKGRAIHIPADLESERIRVFHAGTAMEGEQLVTAGGRVLGVTGVGPSFAEAARASRYGAEQIAFEGKQWRSDIGRSEDG